MNFVAVKPIASLGEMSKNTVNRAEHIGHQARKLTLRSVAATLPDMHPSKVEQKRRNFVLKNATYSTKTTAVSDPTLASHTRGVTALPWQTFGALGARCFGRSSPNRQARRPRWSRCHLRTRRTPRATSHLTPDRASRQCSSWTRTISEGTDWVSSHMTRHVQTTRCRV